MEAAEQAVEWSSDLNFGKDEEDEFDLKGRKRVDYDFDNWDLEGWDLNITTIPDPKATNVTHAVSSAAPGQ